MMRNVAHFIAAQLRDVHLDTAPDDVRQAIAASYAQDDRKALVTTPPGITVYEMFSREAHEASHAIGALQFGAKNIVVVIRNDATGMCSYDPIEKTADQITINLIGTIAEVRLKPSAIKLYRNGCNDFTAARILIDKHNSSGAWPPLTCERAAQTACDFVDTWWTQILALAMLLSKSGTLTDAEIRRCAP